MSKRRRIVIIGLDGGTFNIIDPLLKRAALPFIGGLITEGAKGVLKSTVPPVTASAWVSFMTGKNPGNHGLFDFQKLDPTSGEKTLTLSTDCKSPTLWDYLTEAGKRVVLVNVPMTYPPKALNGIMICGFPVSGNVNFVYPPEKYNHIRSRGYITDWTEMSRNKTAIFVTKLKIMKEVERRRLKVFLSLLKEYPWDVAMVVISGTDHVSHREWQKGNRKAVEEYYKYIDSLLFDMVRDSIFKGCSFIVMSDHGFTSTKKVFYMNAWLHKQGYFKYLKGVNSSYDEFMKSKRRQHNKFKKLITILARIGFTRDNLKYVAKKTGAIKLERFIPESMLDFFPSHDIVPIWEETTAYMTSNSAKGVNINLLGRGKGGIVPASRYKEVRRKIVEELRNLKDDDGELIFSFVDVREKVYKGPFLGLAQDIVGWPSNNYNIRIDPGRRHYIECVTDARHDIDGIFIFKGEGVKRSYHETLSLSLEDIAPTVLHYLGLAYPSDMDGKVITGLFEENNKFSDRKIKTIEPIKLQKKVEKEKDEILEEISKKLKWLGYL